MGDEYLPPVVTKLKADLSDFMAGIIQARAAMRQFAQDTRADLIESSRMAGGGAGFNMITEMRTTIKEQMTGLGDDIDDKLRDDVVPKFNKAGADAGMGLVQGLQKLAMPLLITAIVAASPAIATAIAGAIQLGLGLGFIGIGAYMLRNEPALIAAATRFRDRVAAVFRTSSAPMLMPLVRALDILTASFERLGPSISRSFAALAPAIEPLAVGLAGMMEAMGPGLTALVIAAGPIIMEFAKTLPGIGTSLGEFFQMIADNAPTISLFIQDMGRIIPAIVRGLSMMLNFLIGVYDFVHKIHAAMKGAGWETPFHGFINTGKAVWAWIQETGPKIGQWFTDLGVKIEDFADKAADKVGEFVDRAGAWFAKIPGVIGGAIAAVPGILAEAAITAFDGFFYWTSFGVTKVIMFLNQLPMQLKIILGTMWIELNKLFNDGVDAVEKSAESVPTRVGRWFGQLWHDAGRWFGEIRLVVVTTTGAMINDVLAWLGQLPHRASIIFGVFRDRAVTFFWDASKWLYQAGKDVLNGLVKGILDSVDSAVNAIKRALDKIKRGAREALGISSPSKVFAEMGRYTMVGYMQGIQGEQGSLARLMGMLAPPTVTAGTNAGLALAAAGGGTGGSGVSAADQRPILVQLVLDGSVLAERLIPHAQRRKLRTGETGFA